MCLSRSKDGRGLIGVQDTVEAAIFGLRNYVRNSKERLVIAAHTIKDKKTMKIEKHQMSTKRGKRMKGKQWMQKQFHGQFIRQTKGKESED